MSFVSANRGRRPRQQVSGVGTAFLLLGRKLHTSTITVSPRNKSSLEKRGQKDVSRNDDRRSDQQRGARGRARAPGKAARLAAFCAAEFGISGAPHGVARAGIGWSSVNGSRGN